jgi:hypothetical protein
MKGRVEIGGGRWEDMKKTKRKIIIRRTRYYYLRKKINLCPRIQSSIIA